MLPIRGKNLWLLCLIEYALVTSGLWMVFLVHIPMLSLGNVIWAIVFKYPHSTLRTILLQLMRVPLCLLACWQSIELGCSWFYEEMVKRTHGRVSTSRERKRRFCEAYEHKKTVKRYICGKFGYNRRKWKNQIPGEMLEPKKVKKTKCSSNLC